MPTHFPCVQASATWLAFLSLQQRRFLPHLLMIAANTLHPQLLQRSLLLLSALLQQQEQRLGQQLLLDGLLEVLTEVLLPVAQAAAVHLTAAYHLTTTDAGSKMPSTAAGVTTKQSSRGPQEVTWRAALLSCTGSQTCCWLSWRSWNSWLCSQNWQMQQEQQPQLAGLLLELLPVCVAE